MYLQLFLYNFTLPEDRPRKKRTHSSEKKHKRKKIRTSHNVNSGHLNLSFDKSTETTKKITWDEVILVLL